MFARIQAANTRSHAMNKTFGALGIEKNGG
jgi:hypothetical protein